MKKYNSSLSTSLMIFLTIRHRMSKLTLCSHCSENSSLKAGVGLLALLFAACSSPQLPTDYKQSNQLPKIYPDYVNVTVPVNIAPLTFMPDDPTTDMIARYKVGDEEVVYADKMQPTAEEWKRLIEKAKGGKIEVDVYTQAGDQWTRYKPFCIYVSPDSA